MAVCIIQWQTEDVTEGWFAKEYGEGSSRLGRLLPAPGEPNVEDPENGPSEGDVPLHWV